MKKTALTALFSALIVLVTGMSTDIAIRAADQDADLRILDSPVVLEFPATELGLLAFDEPWTVSDDITNFVCDDVMIEGLTLTKIQKKMHPSRGKEGGPFMMLKTTVRTYTKPSYDRLVDVRFELLSGETQLLEWGIYDINAEEGYHKKKTARYPYRPIEEFEELLAQPDIRLRITLEVEDNS